jgi:hypothetical protein
MNPNLNHILIPRKDSGPSKTFYVKRQAPDGQMKEFESIPIRENESQFAHVKYISSNFHSISGMSGRKS